MASLARAGRALPDPTVLINAAPLLEAQASSAIENIVTTADELFKHVEIGGGDHATKAALRYRTALFAGLEVIRDSAESMIRTIDGIHDCQEEVGELARAATIGGRDARLLALLFEQPYGRIATVVDRCDVTRHTASSWLGALVEADVLRDVEVGRVRLFLNHRILETLTRAD